MFGDYMAYGMFIEENKKKLNDMVYIISTHADLPVSKNFLNELLDRHEIDRSLLDDEDIRKIKTLL